MWFLGIDVGTTHLKVAGVTADGRALEPLKTRTPVRQEGEAVWHDGEAVWSAVRTLVTEYAAGAVAAADAGPLAAIAIAGFGQEEAFPVDADGTPLAGSRAWWQSWPERALDAATSVWFDSPEHYRISGMRLRDNQTPERLAQFRRRDPEGWRRTRHWVDFGSYLGFRLTGRWAASTTQLSHSQLVDLATLEPHVPSLERLGVPADLLPPAARPGERVGALLLDALPGVALTPDAQLRMGGHDQVLAAYAAAERDGSTVVDSIGTAEYVMVVGDAARPDERLHELCADVEHGWGEGGYVLGWGLPTGKLLQLLAERLLGGDFERLLAAIDPAGDVEPEPGVVFTVNDLRDLGDELFVIEGAAFDADPERVARACVEQLSRRIRATVDELAAHGGTALDTVTLTGSLFQRPEMLRHREYTWQLPLRVSALGEAVATGTAELARAAVRRDAAVVPS